MENRLTDNEIMTFEKAMFILRHGSCEGEHKCLEAVLVIEEEVNRQKAESEEQHRKIEFLQASKDLNQAEFAELKAELELKKAEIERLEKKYSFLHKRYIDMMQMKIDVSVEELIQAQSEAIKDVLLTLETAVEESDKYIREYEDSREQRAYNQAFKDAYNLVKEMKG